MVNNNSSFFYVGIDRHLEEEIQT